MPYGYYGYYFDPTYILIIIAAIISLIAQWRVNSAFSKYSRVFAGLLHDARFTQRAVIPQKVLHLPGTFPEAPMDHGEIFFFKFARAHLFG